MHPTINYKEKQAECPPIQMEPVDLSVNSRSATTVGGRVILSAADDDSSSNSSSSSSRRRLSPDSKLKRRSHSPPNGIDLRVNKQSGL